MSSFAQIALGFSLLLGAVACGGSQKPADTPAPATSSAAASASASAPSTPDALPEPVAAAVTRVRAMLDKVDDAQIQAAFSSAFLASIPPAKVTEVFNQTHKSVGPCTSHKPLKIKNSTTAVVRIDCQDGAIDATIVVKPESPYLMDGLLLRPAGS